VCKKDEIYTKVKLCLRLMRMQDDKKGKDGILRTQNACRAPAENGIFDVTQGQTF
jgi:hypothetical protein